MPAIPTDSRNTPPAGEGPAPEEPPPSEPPSPGARAPARQGDGPGATRWKVVETSEVTDESIEKILNEWSGLGWELEGIRFAMRESSRRPAMAFVCFVRGGAGRPAGADPGAAGA